MNHGHELHGGDLCDDDGTGCCIVCGASMTYTCETCGGTSYHRQGCIESEPDEDERFVSAARTSAMWDVVLTVGGLLALALMARACIG